MTSLAEAEVSERASAENTSAVCSQTLLKYCLSLSIKSQKILISFLSISHIPNILNILFRKNKYEKCPFFHLSPCPSKCLCTVSCQLYVSRRRLVCFTAKQGDFNIGSYLGRWFFSWTFSTECRVSGRESWMIFPALSRLELEFPRHRWAVDDGEILMTFTGLSSARAIIRMMLLVNWITLFWFSWLFGSLSSFALYLLSDAFFFPFLFHHYFIEMPPDFTGNRFSTQPQAHSCETRLSQRLVILHTLRKFKIICD